MECLAQAVVNKGIRGLAEFVPGGPYLLDVAGDAYRLYCERKRHAELCDDLEKVAAAGIEEAKQAAEEVARKLAGRLRSKTASPWSCTSRNSPGASASRSSAPQTRPGCLFLPTSS